eukprot:15103617-Ditylum_brightwellii.AAC.1
MQLQIEGISEEAKIGYRLPQIINNLVTVAELCDVGGKVASEEPLMPNQHLELTNRNIQARILNSNYLMRKFANQRQ